MTQHSVVRTPSEKLITVYIRWPADTDEQAEAERRGGHYHGLCFFAGYRAGYDALRALLPEAFDPRRTCAPRIRARKLQRRLPHALAVLQRRLTSEYGADPESKAMHDMMDSFEYFVALCARKEFESGAACSFTIGE